MQKKENLRSVGVAFCEGEQEKIVMANVEILSRRRRQESAAFSARIATSRRGCTFIPSSEKQGGTAELSSSASDKSTGNFSTADMGISPL